MAMAITEAAARYEVFTVVFPIMVVIEAACIEGMQTAGMPWDVCPKRLACYGI